MDIELENVEPIKILDKVIDIENTKEFWDFIKTYQNFSPMGIQWGASDLYLDFFSEIDDCIIIYKKFEQEFCFVNCNKNSISKDQKFDAWIFLINDEKCMEDYNNEIKEFLKKFNIREYYGNTPLDDIFKTKQDADLI